MHGIWPTETKKFITSKGPVQSETFITDLTTEALDDELADFRRDFNSGTGLLINETNASYLVFRNNLLSLPKYVKQNGIIFLVPGLGDDKRIFGYNAMTRSYTLFDFARNTYDYSFDANVLSNLIEGASNNRPQIGVGDRKPAFRFSNVSRNLLVDSMPGVGSNWIFSSNVQITPTMWGENASIFPEGLTTQEYMYNIRYSPLPDKTYTLSFFIKEENLNIGGSGSSYDCSIVAGGKILTTPVTVRKVSNYLENSGAIYSTTFTVDATSSNIGLIHNTTHRNTNTVTLLGIQLEEGSDSHNFIRTVLSSALRPADQLSIDMNCLGYDEWTIYMDFSYQRTNDTQPCYILSTDSTDSHSYLYSRGPGDISTHMGYNGGIMNLTGFPQNTRQRVALKYSKTRDPRGPYCTIQREGKDSDDNEWSSGSPNTTLIPFNNHLEFFTGPGFVNAELKALVIFDRWIDLSEADLNDI